MFSSIFYFFNIIVHKQKSASKSEDYLITRSKNLTPVKVESEKPAVQKPDEVLDTFDAIKKINTEEFMQKYIDYFWRHHSGHHSGWAPSKSSETSAKLKDHFMQQLNEKNAYLFEFLNSTTNEVFLKSLLFSLSLIAIFSSFCFCFFVFVSKNLVYALLNLIITFLSIILILIFLNVEFVSWIFLIVYVGAVSILFLFVIMMSGSDKLRQHNQVNNLWIACVLYALLVPPACLLIVSNTKRFLLLQKAASLETTSIKFLNYNCRNIYKANDISIFSNSFYTERSCIVLLIGMVLLASMLGSIALALSTTTDKKN